MKRGQERPVGIIELGRTPAADVRNPATLLVCLEARCRRIEQLRIGIAHHERTSKLVQPAQDLAWLRPRRRNVAEADDLIRRLCRQGIQHGVERREIAVNIRNQRDGQAHGCLIPVQTDNFGLRYDGLEGVVLA